MEGQATLRASRGHLGSLRLDEIRSTPLLTLRAAAGAVYLVGGTATPLGGDNAALLLDVDHDATVQIRSVAAAVARPGPDTPESRFTVHARLGPRATLRWELEPGVAAARSAMVSEVYVDMAADARLWWRDELMLGRCGEPSGRWSSYLHVDRGGRPLLRHHLSLGPTPATSGPALVGDWRAVASLLVVGNAPGGRTVRRPDGQAAALSLAGGDATLVSAMAVDHPALRSLLDATVVQPPQLLP
jgi:urease accessory protein